MFSDKMWICLSIKYNNSYTNELVSVFFRLWQVHANIKIIPTYGECGKIGCEAEKKTCHNKINDEQEM